MDTTEGLFYGGVATLLGGAVLAVLLRPGSGSPPPPPPPCNPPCGSGCTCLSDVSCSCPPPTCNPACGAGCSCISGVCHCPPPTCTPPCGTGCTCINGHCNCPPPTCNPPCATGCTCISGVCQCGSGPIPPPAGAILATKFGADPTGSKDSTAAIINAMAVAGPGQVVWLSDNNNNPATYILSNHLPVTVPGIMVAGAGRGWVNLLQTQRVDIFEVSADDFTVQDLSADTATHNTTYPRILKDPDPGILFCHANGLKMLRINGKTGTGFGMRVTGSSPCENFPMSGSLIEDVAMQSLAYGGGFVAIDIDCQGNNGVWTWIRNCTATGTMSVFYDSFVGVDGFTMTPNKYQMSCAPCIIISTTAKGPSHDLSFSNIKSAGGPIKVLYKDGLTGPVPNLTVPAPGYSTCP